jgi:hypothetical protein
MNLLFQYSNVHFARRNLLNEIVYTVNEDLEKSFKYSENTCNVHDLNVTILTKVSSTGIKTKRAAVGNMIRS